jgi:U4/U6.U5 tri-snRNP-associated protein 2
VEEKNPTIVNFPLRGLDLKDCMHINSLRNFLTVFFLMNLLDIETPTEDLPTLYDLIANVTHESVAGTTRDKENTAWKAYLRAAGGGGDSERWFMIQDLIVEETRKEMIFLGETVIQVKLLHMVSN